MLQGFNRELLIRVVLITCMTVSFQDLAYETRLMAKLS